MRIVVFGSSLQLVSLFRARCQCALQLATTVFYVMFLLKLVCGSIVCSVCFSADELDPESNELHILF